jgi:hypothetical protein
LFGCESLTHGRLIHDHLKVELLTSRAVAKVILGDDLAESVQLRRRGEETSTALAGFELYGPDCIPIELPEGFGDSYLVVQFGRFFWTGTNTVRAIDALGLGVPEIPKLSLVGMFKGHGWATHFACDTTRAGFDIESDATQEKSNGNEHDFGTENVNVPHVLANKGHSVEMAMG